MIVIIGAGPAGLAAAKAVTEQGQSVTILDSQPRGGGQYWRHISDVHGYRSLRSKKYLDQLESNPLITHISGAQVWSAEKSDNAIQLNFLHEGMEKKLLASKLIVATGSYDRTLPFPGWTTSGVMTPGGAQALLKGHGVVAGQKIVVSGTGPFLLPVATALAERGAKVEMYEAQNPLRWVLSPIALLLNPAKFLELIYYARAIFKSKIKVQFGCAVTSFDNGKAYISKVRSDLTIKKPNFTSVECDVLATGWGFLPDLSLGGILGCSQILDKDETVIFAVDGEQRSSVPNIWIAGEATGIGGADLALVEGEIAGLSASGSAIPLNLIWKRKTKRIFARALQRSYPVGQGWQEWLHKSTIVCRCEEVSCQEIIESVQDLGAEDARTSKLFTRAGMGLCQGRVCSRNVSDIVAGITKCAVSPTERISASNRPLAAPISLGVLAAGQSQDMK
jgi:NADPH-dependent 2,4-dienoyl-CoA reductase/sulfur reductase-like enzyme